jgi:FkbM family methyltransferase
MIRNYLKKLGKRIDRNVVRIFEKYIFFRKVDIAWSYYHTIGVHHCEVGEKLFISKSLPMLLESSKETIFLDVGGNIGDYSRSLRTAFPRSKIFIFEPNPTTFSYLEKSFEGDHNIIALNAGLSSHRNELELYVYPERETTGHASVYKEVFKKLHSESSPISFKCEFNTLDQFMSDQCISYINFLKIDTEGHEIDILKGGKQALENRQIGIIQLEFNEMNVISRTFLRDFYDLIGDSYLFYRIQRSGLLRPLGKYWAGNEIFQFQNIICISNRINIPEALISPSHVVMIQR